MRSRLLLIGSVLIVMGAITSAAAWQLSRVGVHEGYAPPQPIAFSHKVHAGDWKVPCLYCHSAARTSRHAGIPSANVCMNCHAILQKEVAELEKLKEFIQQDRPIAWVKVHNLPDFVYFNHSQHVLAAVTCQECHGPVETMARLRQESPLTMGWCLECHRERGLIGARQKHIAAQTHSDAATLASLPGLDCGKCHY